MTEKSYKVGFANLDDTNPFALELRHSFEAAAAATPQLELIVRDNAMSSERARVNIEAFLNAEVDVVVMFHIDQRMSQQLIFPLRLNRIPVIAIDIPIPGTYYFGVNNKEAGQVAGAALVAWVNQHWNRVLDKLICLTEYRVLDFTQQRFTEVIEAVSANFAIHPERDVLYIDNGSSADISKQRFSKLLKQWRYQRHIGVVCINDNTAQGVIDAVRDCQRYDDVAIVSYDGTEVAQAAFQGNDIHFVTSPYISQRESGPVLLDLCLKLARGEHIPSQNFVQTVPLTWENYDQLRSG
jgi:ABC-type sugar transport system substrate-binding protein